MIKFVNVSKKYSDGTEAIKGIDIEIPEGKLVALIGPSGCGKTTTMKMINKLITPTKGTIFINGEDITAKNEVELRRNIGYVIQRIGLLPHMTIEENISLVPRLKGWKKEEYQSRVNELLELVGLEPDTFKKRYPLELSGGQQQRVGVVRALAAEPPIILMDEPFSALDPISREQLQDELKALQKKIHKTIVFVTHDMDEALKIADEIVIMRDGKIEQIATPEQLLQNPANDFVHTFIGEDRINKGNSNRHVMDIMISLNESDLLEKELPTISWESTITEAAKQLIQKKVDKIAVVKNKEIVGTITKEEVLHFVAGIRREEESSC
ncbi:osmoprotectant transport system ATP-binding protein [Bacillus pakistanensis]|uniref:Quaternary amine transport ATP-binding protein n=1 Tax=Rossellomorea pakistanensis TaxID=992288 RepID=A0ABS2N8L1_9BACI|nr:betaine/proline/choline family ABC transporter ATP-binding protein [Bacillus pakistanensis]MBM7583901.1 osmoprotectant transport system ATP-binding protein [Bacillus pakistanensis]